MPGDLTIDNQVSRVDRQFYNQGEIMLHPDLYDLFRNATMHHGWFTLEAGECDAPTGFFALAEIRHDEVDLWLELFDREGMGHGLSDEDMIGVYLYRQNSDGIGSVEKFDSATEARAAFYELWVELDEWETNLENEAWAMNIGDLVPLVSNGELTENYV
ncbi:hypothetical protein WC1_65 [Rhodococcus phage WC1]|uniref:Uncharacterized protein n=1 Tax=Rhodococcus phage Hiro TaxID=2015828 RepID=A0A222ZIF9_9CAUD|nr:hypothetical protein HWB24_gp07 [Rhodococcus phage Hiro]AOT23631.1 hypothetical protein SEA_HARLEQUIN_65 [Rhodococcus phage Harlequin]ASJ78867.1 hypothetical protein SEA_JESTER_64 [Rhodococcus phage Jester]AWY04663.1 hypothetical protein PBI_BRYCE_64 [Rhodococcus phage Bryce]QXH81137.1 hypothetical protein WC1_65 [Rhodococcus phage WC1]ASR84248.1 hypothetical protein SEA_HIRO_65 [Rhodococcus phage Hiro]